MKYDGRTCEGCSACCFSPSIAELDKGEAEWCRHCSTHKSCDIYRKRPAVCRLYTCLWLRHGFGRKPSEMGIVLDGLVLNTGERMLPVVYFSELWPGALDTEEVEGLVRYFNQTQRMAVCKNRLSPSGVYEKGSLVISEDLMSEEEAIQLREFFRRLD